MSNCITISYILNVCHQYIRNQLVIIILVCLLTFTPYRIHVINDVVNNVFDCTCLMALNIVNSFVLVFQLFTRYNVLVLAGI